MEYFSQFNESIFNLTFYGDYNQTWFLFPPQLPPSPMQSDMLIYIKKYAYLITCIIGILGNILIFFIYTKTKLKAPSTARYLAAVSLADSGFLLVVMCVKLEESYRIRVHTVIGPCQLITFGDHAFSFLSRWYLTAVIVEKFIGVMWPRKKTKMCTVFRAKCVIICLAVMGIVCYLYTTWFIGVYGDPPVCRLIYSNKQVFESWKVLSKLDAIINFVIPYLTIFNCTWMIAFGSWEFRKRSREWYLRQRRTAAAEVKEFRTTPLLITLSTVTLLLSIPNSVMRILAISDDFMPTKTSMFLMTLFHYFVVLNSAVKICIYLLASHTFARQVGKQFCSLKRIWKKSSTTEC